MVVVPAKRALARHGGWCGDPKKLVSLCGGSAFNAASPLLLGVKLTWLLFGGSFVVCPSLACILTPEGSSHLGLLWWDDGAGEEEEEDDDDEDEDDGEGG